MADNKTPASDNTRNSATEDLFNREATSRVNPNRKITDDIFGRDQQGSEELFKQNIQGRIDHEADDQLLPDIQSDGFEFQLNTSISDYLNADGILPAGTELATLRVPVDGGDFSYQLDDFQFRIDGDALVLNQDLSLLGDTEFNIDVQVSSNSSAFEIDVPVAINLEQLGELAEEYVNQAPEDIELSTYALDENTEAGTVVANITTIDIDNAFGFVYELTGEGADKFEVEGNQLVTKEGAVFDFETQPQHNVEITVTDPAGNTYTEVITLDLNDINEAPVLSDEFFESVEGGEVFTGELDAWDQDINEQLTFVIADGFEAPPGFSLSANGDYSFDPTDSAYDHLGVGDSQFISVPVTVIDKGGLESNAQVRITVEGTNDAPVAGSDIVLDTAEGDSSITGQLIAIDVDDDASLTFTVTDGVASPAGFALTSDGSYSFDPDDSAYQGMAVGETVVISVPVTVTDEYGASDSQNIEITLTGTNDAPVAGMNIMMNTTEDGDSLSGQLSATDADEGAVLTFYIADEQDQPAGFVLDADGRYSFDPSESDYQHLAEGESQLLTIPVTVSDEHGATDTQYVYIEVKGTNDTPEAISLSSNNVQENAAGSVIGTIATDDADQNDQHTYTVSDSRFEIVADGNGNQQLKLRDGVSLDNEAENGAVSLTVTTTDSSGASYSEGFTINIGDVNENPTGINLSANSVDENAEGALAGTVTTTDDDAREAHSYSVSDDRFEIVDDGNGNQQLKLKDGVALDNEAEGGSITVTVTTTDGSGASYSEDFTINVGDVNEGPTDIDLSANSVEENASGAAVGAVTTADEDNPEVHTYTVSDSRFEVVDDGNGNQQLKLKDGIALDSEAENGAVSVTVTTTDGSGASYSEAFSISVADVNEGPTDIDLSASRVDENAAGATIGNLTTADEDSPETHSYTGPTTALK